MGFFVGVRGGCKACGILSSPARDWTCPACPGRQSLHHWTAREVPRLSVFNDSIYDVLCPALSIPQEVEISHRTWGIGTDQECVFSEGRPLCCLHHFCTSESQWWLFVDVVTKRCCMKYKMIHHGWWGSASVDPAKNKTIMYIHVVKNTLTQEALSLPTPELHGQESCFIIGEEIANKTPQSILLKCI